MIFYNILNSYLAEDILVVMNISDYFSRDADRRGRFIFNLIAPVYSCVDFWLIKKYTQVIELLNKNIPLDGRTVLDIGCGTGAWTSSFQKFSCPDLVGVDFSRAMIKKAEKKYPQLSFFEMTAKNLSDFRDNQFDIVTASYVLHGIKEDERKKILLEMKRIAKNVVVIHDFYGRTELFIRFLEFFERSDYKQFKKHFSKEMDNLFRETEVIDTNLGTGLYIGIKHHL